VFFVVSEASLATGGPADLWMKTKRTEGVTGLAIGGAGGGGVDGHLGGGELVAGYGSQNKGKEQLTGDEADASKDN